MAKATKFIEGTHKTSIKSRRYSRTKPQVIY